MVSPVINKINLTNSLVWQRSLMTPANKMNYADKPSNFRNDAQIVMGGDPFKATGKFANVSQNVGPVPSFTDVVPGIY